MSSQNISKDNKAIARHTAAIFGGAPRGRKGVTTDSRYHLNRGRKGVTTDSRYHLNQ